MTAERPRGSISSLLSSAKGRLSRKFHKGAKRRRKKLNVALARVAKGDKKAAFGPGASSSAASAQVGNGRNRAFKGESIKTSDTFTCAHYPKSAGTAAALRSLIADPANGLTVLSSLPPPSLSVVIDAMQSRVLAVDETLLASGTMSDTIFLVEKGALADGSDASKPWFLVACELALFMSMPIDANIVAAEPTTVWFISRIDFRTHLAQASQGHSRSRIPRGALALEYGSCVVEGTLKKLAFKSRANWKKRWMQVSIFLPGEDANMPDVPAHAQLYYFKSKSRPRVGGISQNVPQGHVLIDHEADASVIPQLSAKRKFVFRIFTGGEEYIFAAESAEVNQQWVNMINQTIGELKVAFAAAAQAPAVVADAAGDASSASAAPPAAPSVIEEDSEEATRRASALSSVSELSGGVGSISLGGSGDADALAEGWEELQDEAGQTYYHNESSGTTQWDRPVAGGESGGAAAAAVDAADAWVEHSSSSGDAYFYNTVTHESAWDDPRPAAAAGAAPSSEEAAGPAVVKREIISAGVDSTAAEGAGGAEDEDEDEGEEVALGPWLPSVTYDELAMLKTLGQVRTPFFLHYLRTYILLTNLLTYLLTSQGSFGKVLLASRGGETYAVKILIKSFIVENQATGMVMAEKNAMAAFSGVGRNNPFITELVGTHQDRENLYFILELLQGGELLALLDRKEFLSEKEMAFYMGCVVEATHALHARGWLFRDLKPDNVLIDSRGYAKIADFGLAKNIGFDASNQTTYTLCG